MQILIEIIKQWHIDENSVQNSNISNFFYSIEMKLRVIRNDWKIKKTINCVQISKIIMNRTKTVS